MMFLLPSRCAMFAILLTSVISLALGRVNAERIPVRYIEGTVHGFLVLRTLDGKTLAAGDLVQVARGDHVVARLVFRFKDGSVDDETTVFSQHQSFSLVSDHHVQKGPSFPHPMDVSIDANTGQIKARSSESGEDKVEMHHLDLPPDLANGLILTILKNLRPAVKETRVSFVATTSKPRLVKLLITPEGKETFSAAGWRHASIHYRVKVEFGGVAGAVAPLVGKQPQDTHVWILGGKAPAFVKMEGPLYQGGPAWRIEPTSPVWLGGPTTIDQ